MKVVSNQDCLHSSGVGGPFYSLFAGLTGVNSGICMKFITPLISPFTFLLCLLFPSFYAAFVRCGIKDSNGKYPELKAFSKIISSSFKSFAVQTLVWWFCIAAAVAIFSIRSQDAAAIYMEQARAHQELQLGTQEQLQYSNTLIQTIAMSGFALLLILGILQNISMSYAAGIKTPLVNGLKSWAVNLPGELLLAVITIVAFAIIEKYFAMLKLRYLEAYILGKKAFDPAIPFILLRIYALNAAFCAQAVMAAISLKLIRFNFAKLKFNQK